MSCSSKIMKVGEHIFRVKLNDFKLEIIESGLPNVDKLLMALMSDVEIRNAINEYQKSIADKEIFAKVIKLVNDSVCTIVVDTVSFENGKKVSSKTPCILFENDGTNKIISIKSMSIGEFMEIVNNLFPNLISANPDILREQAGVEYLSENYVQIQSLLEDGFHKHVNFELK